MIFINKKSCGEISKYRFVNKGYFRYDIELAFLGEV